MNQLAINFVFTMFWAAITGSFSALNIGFGFILSAITLYLMREEIGKRGYLSKALRIFLLLLLFIKELALSAWKVALMVIAPKMDLKPGIFAFELTVDRDFEITLLANLITLTPGTLSVDVSDDRKVLYVHAIDCSDPEGARADIANGFEKRILEAFR